MVDSVLKIHKPFFIIKGNYQDISVLTQLFANFRPVKFRSRDRALPNSVCTNYL